MELTKNTFYLIFSVLFFIFSGWVVFILMPFFLDAGSRLICMLDAGDAGIRRL
jgi:hypothetical protein